MRALVRSLQEELRALRRDNALLRQSQLTDPRWLPPPGVYTAASTPSAALPSQPSPAQLDPAAATSSAQPARAADDQGPTTPERDTAMFCALGQHDRSHGDTPDGKRHAVRSLEATTINDQ